MLSANTAEPGAKFNAKIPWASRQNPNVTRRRSPNGGATILNIQNRHLSPPPPIINQV
jgi:hypothetical protein